MRCFHKEKGHFFVSLKEDGLVLYRLVSDHQSKMAFQNIGFQNPQPAPNIQFQNPPGRFPQPGQGILSSKSTGNIFDSTKF
jgi:hypothetical protein